MPCSAWADPGWCRAANPIRPPSPLAPKRRLRWLGTLAASLGMRWSIRDKLARRRVLLLVSKFDHCLGDLLYRERIGELAMDVVGIVSNHPRNMFNIGLLGDIPFHHLPVTKDGK